MKLRVKDIDSGQGTIAIHDASRGDWREPRQTLQSEARRVAEPGGGEDINGGKHRMVPLPKALEQRLQDHLRKTRERHLADLAIGAGEAHINESLQRKYPNAAKECPWQHVFSSAKLSAHPRTGHVARFHLHETSLQRQFKRAVDKSGVAKRVTFLTLRHSFATHLLEGGRHSNRPGSSRPCRRLDDDDLFACIEEAGRGCAESA